MKAWSLAICVILISANYVDALSTSRKETTRANKISESFKQLDLPAAEIDPNIGPIAPTVEEVVANAVEETAGTVGTENEVSGAAVDAIEQAASVDQVSTSPSLTEETNPVNEDDPNELSKYCKCSDTHCDCCRNFALPIVPVRGPGCAKITYLGNEKMSVSIKYGDIILATRTISGKRSKPICFGLPGGFNQFCGRVYGLSKGKDDFKACLGLELRGDEEVEAALRVSCFKFGPKGLQVAEAEPLPDAPKDEEEDDDIFGFGAGGSDDDYDEEDDEDEDEEEDDDAEEPEDDDDAEADEEPSDDADYGGFSFAGLLDELDDSEESTSPVQQTRKEQKELAQSKDEQGTPAEADMTAAAASAAVVETKPTKAKKNKKKKKKSPENDFALDILNGILDFFN